MKAFFMKNHTKEKRILFDLNHPADYHFFKNLFIQLHLNDYQIFVIARNKECLQDLLRNDGIPFQNRGKGSHSKIGKYIYGLYLLVLILIKIIRARPGTTISLSSPYLAVASRIAGTPCITYDDTDENPRLRPMLKQSTYIFSPSTYPHSFHLNHFRLQAFKELAYLHPSYFQKNQYGKGVFFRLTRTDSIHHSTKSKIDIEHIIEQVNKISKQTPTFLSTEVEISWNLQKEVRMANTIRIHEELNECRVFWGNSATMAAESAMLGIPSVFVGGEKFAYISELESYGLLFYYTPDQIDESFQKLNELMEEQSTDKYGRLRQKLLDRKIDITGFLFWFIENLPESASIIQSDPEYHLRFIT